MSTYSTNPNSPKQHILHFETLHCITAHLHKVKLSSYLLQRPTVAVIHVSEDRKQMTSGCLLTAKRIGLKHVIALSETLKHFSKHIKREYQGQRFSRAIPHVDWMDQFRELGGVGDLQGNQFMWPEGVWLTVDVIRPSCFTFNDSCRTKHLPKYLINWKQAHTLTHIYSFRAHT